MLWVLVLGRLLILWLLSLILWQTVWNRKAHIILGGFGLVHQLDCQLVLVITGHMNTEVLSGVIRILKRDVDSVVCLIDPSGQLLIGRTQLLLVTLGKLLLGGPLWVEIFSLCEQRLKFSLKKRYHLSLLVLGIASQFCHLTGRLRLEILLKPQELLQLDLIVLGDPEKWVIFSIQVEDVILHDIMILIGQHDLTD